MLPHASSHPGNGPDGCQLPWLPTQKMTILNPCLVSYCLVSTFKPLWSFQNHFTLCVSHTHWLKIRGGSGTKQIQLNMGSQHSPPDPWRQPFHSMTRASGTAPPPHSTPTSLWSLVAALSTRRALFIQWLLLMTPFYVSPRALRCSTETKGQIPKPCEKLSVWMHCNKYQGCF